jgi:hypothetical protein
MSSHLLHPIVLMKMKEDCSTHVASGRNALVGGLPGAWA